MKKVDKKFIETLHLSNRTKAPSPLSLELYGLKIEESLFVSKEEWAVMGYKTEPSNLISSAVYQPRSKNYGRKFSTRKAVEGWLITRIK